MKNKSVGILTLGLIIPGKTNYQKSKKRKFWQKIENIF